MERNLSSWVNQHLREGDNLGEQARVMYDLTPLHSTKHERSISAIKQLHEYVCQLSINCTHICTYGDNVTVR